MDVRVLGSVALGDPTARLGRRDRIVLGVLAVRRGQLVSAETLADALWDGIPPKTWPKVVQGCIVRLRHALGSDAIETAGNSYRLTIPADDVDAARFERLVDRARELLALGEPDRATYAVDEALQLWGGPPWPDLVRWEPGEVEAQRLEELRLSAEELRVDASLEAGRVQQVLGEAQAQVKAHPLREHRWTSLARALYQSGRQGDALQVLRQARALLADELGVDPGPELVAIEQAVLRQDPSLVSPALPDAAAVCPYQGLVPYGVEDAESFFGRTAQIRECMTRLTEQGVLAIVGPSGSGKSSLARAGVAAALQRTGRAVVVINPGTRPLDALTAVPARGAPVLVVDQCEEVVTLCEDEEERAAFLRAVAEHADRAPVIVTLRADKLGDFTAYPDFARLMERGLYLLSAMDAAGLREAIEAPARQAGLLLEPGLVDLLVREVEGEPGSLPLLSHALRQTWLKREGSTLTVAGYQSTGGIRGAVAQTADLVYEQVPEAQRGVLRDLLLRLVVPTAEGEPVRSRVPRKSVATDTAHEQMIETLVRARLLTSDHDVVEMAHESLARAWPRLREWLVDDVEGQRVWRHLTSAAEAWDVMGRPDSELYRGVRLARALEWRDPSDTELNTVEHDFLEASAAAYRSELERERLETARQVSVNRRLRALVAGVAALALVAVTVGVVAFQQAGRADEQATVADARAQEARAHALAASAVGAIDDDPSLAKLLAVSAATTAPMSLETTSALHEVWAADATVARHSLPSGEDGWLAMHPDGAHMAYAGMWWDFPARSLEVVDVATGDKVWSFDLPAEARYDAASVIYPTFSDDGTLVAGGVIWEPNRHNGEGRERGPGEEPPPDFLGGYLWSADTGEVVERVDLGPCGGVIVAVTEQSLLAMRDRGGADSGCAWFYRDEGGAEVLHVDRRTGEQTVIGEGPIYLVANAALSDDGRVAAHSTEGSQVTGEPSTFTVLDLETGEQLMHEEIRVPEMWDISDDGSLVIASMEPVEVWDVTTGARLTTYDGHNTVVNFARLVPGTETVVSAGNDGALRAWDARSGRESGVYPGVGDWAVAPSASGMVAVGRAYDPSVAVVDTQPRGELGKLETCPAFTFSGSLQVSREADLALMAYVCAGANGVVTHGWRPSTRESVFQLSGHQGQVTSLSPDGTKWVRQDGSGTGRPGGQLVAGPLVVRGTGANEVLVELEGMCTYVNTADSPGCSEFPEPPFGAMSFDIQWSPDGRLVAAVLAEFGFAVWDSETGELLHAAYPAQADDGQHPIAHSVQFTPDSQALLVSDPEGRIFRWSTDTWEPELESRIGSEWLGIIGYTPEAESLIVLGGYRVQDIGSTLHWLDPDTLEATRTVGNLHEGTVRAAAIDPGGTRLATVGTEGLARVWDLRTGSLLHQVSFGDQQLQGVAWIDDQHLAVTPRDGDVLFVTVDPEELLDLVRSSLTRGYSETECQTYGFGDACPTLAEMAVRHADDDPDRLTGTFTMSWTPEELAVAMTEGPRDDGLAIAPIGVGSDLARQRSEELAGDLSLTFDEGRYVILRDGQTEPVCAGSYYIVDGVLRLGAERGQCDQGTFFEASYRLDGDLLHLGEESFSGAWWRRLTWTSQPLQLVAEGADN